MDNIYLHILKIWLILVLPVISGWAIKRRIHIPQAMPYKLTFINTVTLASMLSFLAWWNMDFSRLKYLLLPVCGFLITLSCLGLSLILSNRIYKHDNQSKGSFIMAGSISNIGYSLGGIILYMLMGPRGVSVNFLYCFYVTFYVTMFVRPLCLKYESERNLNWIALTRRFFTDIRQLGLATMVIGLGLNLMRVQMPEMAKASIGILVIVTTILQMLAIGFVIRPTKIVSYKSELKGLTLIKFLFSPAVGLLLCWIFGFTGELRRVVFLMSVMPSSITAMNFSILYHLNADLANSSFLVTTGIFFLAIPLFLGITFSLL